MRESGIAVLRTMPTIPSVTYVPATSVLLGTRIRTTRAPLYLLMTTVQSRKSRQSTRFLIRTAVCRQFGQCWFYKLIALSLGLSTRLLRAEPVTGKCYVITFSRAHNLTLADLTPAQIVPIIETWTDLYIAHMSPKSPLAQAASATTLPPLGSDSVITAPREQYRYMQIFENKGAAMGCSNPHPHGQVWTTTGMPEEPGMELTQLQKYRREQGGANLLEDYATLEAAKQERVVFENADFIAICPWWATWPFEVMIVSKVHKRALTDLRDKERQALAEAIAEVTRRYDNLFETQFPYSECSHPVLSDSEAHEC